MPSYAFFQNEFVPLEDAKISIMTHALHYGLAVFEGIRGNWNDEEKQTYIFRMREHYERLFRGCKLLKIEMHYTIDELCQKTIEMVEKCGFQEDIYIRPVAYSSSQSLGVRLHNLEHDFFMFLIPWGPYLDVDKARCAVATYRRPDDSVMPPQLKVAGIYINNALAKTEVYSRGYDEAIMLSSDGFVSEGSGENIFLVMDGKLVTPSPYNNILLGVTRNTVIEIARNELGLETIQRPVSRAELYNAAECFLSGTAAHITPVAEVDDRTIGNGEIGPITRQIQELYARVIYGRHPKYKNWCTPVYSR